jgi:hypothetical protein
VKNPWIKYGCRHKTNVFYKRRNDMADIMIGSARLGENGKITGGEAGDQKQTSILNMGGEAKEKYFMHMVKGETEYDNI